MLKVDFHTWEEIEDENLLFAVIVARYKDKWILSRHKERITWEIPGGHREIGEDINDTASRELYEETGASEFKISPVCIYSVSKEEGDTSNHPDLAFGGLYFADVSELGKLPDSEIGEVILVDELPNELTYPEIQPHLFNKAINFFKIKSL